MEIPFSQFKILSLAFVCLLLNSCTETDKVDISEFIVAENHKIEIVAVEPDVILPVVMVEDEKNRFWVVEMPGYMRDIDGTDEDLADGRIVILTDEDRDGRIDKRKIFLDSLLNPRALCLVYNGLLYTDGTMLKWTNTDNDIPNSTVIVDSFYVVGGNIEHQPNGLLYNIDNWIYSAKSNARYRRFNGKWSKEATTFRGQWGLSMDRLGRLIYNHNSAPLMGDFALPNQNLDNPFLKLNHSTGMYLTDDMRIYPIQATAVNRGYLPEVLDSTEKVINYTSACAPHLFYGSSLAADFQNSAFVCAPEGNLISNYSYDEQSMEADRNLGNDEFLISREESFRPVNLMTGFDGCLYVVDMRKGIIQHSAYMSSYLREKIITRGLDNVNGKGRIYRIRKEGTLPPTTKTDDLNSVELIELLSHNNLQLRIFAQKKLITKQAKEIIESLQVISLKSENVNTRIHAIWTLEGMNALSADFLLKIGNSTDESDVLAQLIIISKGLKNEKISFDELYLKSYKLNSKPVDFLLASVVGNSEMTEHLWFKLANRYPNHPLLSESLVSSIANRGPYFLSKIDDSKHEILSKILKEVINNKNAGDIQSPVLIEKPFDDDRTNGLKKFKTYCTACHGFDGKGLKNLAPSFKGSVIIDGDEVTLASMILNGYSTDKSNYKLMMPAYKEDKNLTNQDIVDIISYLKSTFTSGWSSLKIEDVEALR